MTYGPRGVCSTLLLLLGPSCGFFVTATLAVATGTYGDFAGRDGVVDSVASSEPTVDSATSLLPVVVTTYGVTTCRYGLYSVFSGFLFVPAVIVLGTRYGFATGGGVDAAMLLLPTLVSIGTYG